MRDWNEFVIDIDQILLVLNQVARAPFFSFDRDLLMQMRSLLQFSIPDEEKESKIRRVMALRAAAVHHSSMDYTFYPNHPVNLFYFRLAKALKLADEAVCQILMPGVFQIIGAGFDSQNLKAAEGNFSPALYLSHTRLGAMIALTDTLSYAKENTRYFFPISIDDKIAFDLTAEDRRRIRAIVPPLSEQYVDAIARLHRIQNGSKPSIGWALNELAIALLKSSKIASGTETKASSVELDAPIKVVWEWWTALSVTVKNEIKSLKLASGSVSLESYLLCLFFHHEHIDVIALTEAEKKRVSSELITPCSYQIGLQLDELVRENRTLWNIPLPGMEVEFETPRLPDAEAMNALEAEFEVALASRPSASFGNDSDIANYEPAIAIVMANILNHDTEESELVALAHYAVNLKKLLCVLTILPEERWGDFFRVANVCEQPISTLFFEFFPDEETLLDTSKAFFFLLENLPEKKWSALFSGLLKAKLGYFVDVECMNRLFEMLPEPKWFSLVISIGSIRSKLINNEFDLFAIFPNDNRASCSKLCGYFHPEIRQLFDRRGISKIFDINNPENWGDIYAIFAEYVRSKLIEAAENGTLLRALPSRQQHLFLLMILLDTDFIVENPLLLSEFLKRTDSDKWEIVFDEMDEAQFKKLIPNEHKLTEFLMLFNDDEKINIIRVLSSHSPKIKINMSQFRHLVSTMPSFENLFFLLVQFSLKNMIKENMAAFSETGRLCLHRVNAMKKDFSVFLEKALPLILSNQYIGYNCPSFFEATDTVSKKTKGLVWIFSHLDALEKMEQAKQIAPKAAGMQKLVKLAHYCSFVERRLFERSQLYCELTAHFGVGFFNDVLTHYRYFLSLKNRLSVRGFGLFQQEEQNERSRRDSNESAHSSHEKSEHRSRSVVIPQNRLSFAFQLRGVGFSTNNVEPAISGLSVEKSACL